MQGWTLQDGWGLEHLRLARVDDPGPPGPGQAAVRMKAASLNFRDLGMARGASPATKGVAPEGFVPFSDGAGEVIAVGAGVTRVRVGDRVCPTFFQGWIDGPPTAANRARSLGSPQTPGVLREVLLADAEDLVAIPEHLDFIEAATLPCAGVTAWRALREAGLALGKTVAAEGTGGVSIFTVQFAKLAGARAIVTSSSNAKLARAKALGADHGINYRETPGWGEAVRALTDGRGADIVVEVGGAATLPEALSAAAVYGSIPIVGALSGASQAAMPIVLQKNIRLHGIYVGSRVDFEAMAGAIALHRMRPVVDRVYPFAAVPKALAAMAAGEHFGKICIDFGK